MFSPSAKTVTFSARPSPSVSSRIFTRSRPRPAGLRGYSTLSVTQMRPRSSNVIAIGLTMSGSLATSSTRKPSGTVILATASAGEYGSFGGWSWRCGMTSSAPANANGPQINRMNANAPSEYFIEKPNIVIRGATVACRQSCTRRPRGRFLPGRRETVDCLRGDGPIGDTPC